MAKQPVKKKEFVKPNITDIKSKLGLVVKSVDDLSKSNADKPIDWIVMPPAFENATKLVGFPQGYMSIITGWANTGKSTLKNCLISACIKQGIIPVIFETESNFDFSYAQACGMKCEPIYGDVEVEKVDTETGEVTYELENRIMSYEGDFIYFDNALLAETYGNNDYSTGKQTKSKRKVAVIEDIAFAINTLLDMQDNGEIQQSMCFIWDSVGSIPSFKSYSSKTGNNMFDAGALSQAFNTIANNRIPSSRKIDSPYTNSFVCVNKIWNDSMSSMGGVPSIELKGGKSFFYAARLIIHLGGVGKASTKKLSATAKGQIYNYGIISKIKVTKNHLPTPFNITYEGEIACVHNGLCVPDEIDAYKKTYIGEILKRIQELSNSNEADLAIDAKDIEFEETEVESYD